MPFVERAYGAGALARFEKNNPLAAVPLTLTCALVAFWLGGLTLQAILAEGLPLFGGSAVHLSVWMAGAAAMLAQFVTASDNSTAASPPAIWTAARGAVTRLMALGLTHLVLWIIA